MTVPHYITKTTPRCAASSPAGTRWHDDGNLSSGPFSGHDECLGGKITQPTN